LRTLRCAVEQVAEWYPRLFLEPHIVACVAVLAGYSASPASIAVECENVPTPWPGEEAEFTLSVGWLEETAGKAERLRRTIQAKPLVEMASVALAMVLARKVMRLTKMAVTGYGERTDFYSRGANRFLEISGTE